MKTFPLSAAMFSLCMLFGASAHTQAPLEAKDGVLVDTSGMLVYTFDKDEANSGKSACYDNCAKNWPPVKADAGATAEGNYTIIERDDGTQQWAYQAQPLYTYAKDTKAGEGAGDDVGGVWHVIKHPDVK